MAEWISVKERLPDGCGRYQVFVQNIDESSRKADNRRYPYPTRSINIAYFSDIPGMSMWCYSDFQCQMYMHRVTHWMPLPEPPK